MISIDITVLFHIINMIVLMAVLNKILYQPILAIMDQRQENLDALNDQAEQFERHALNQQADLDRKMHEASVKAKQALDAARSEAEAAGAEKIAAIRQVAEREREKELAEVHSSFAAVRSELLAEVEEFGREMAEKILGRSIAA